jgi:hypothetical protein
MTKDQIKYLRYLDTLHHHEILPNRLYLIGRIQKAMNGTDDLDRYKKRYDLLDLMYPNPSWTEFVVKICTNIQKTTNS